MQTYSSLVNLDELTNKEFNKLRNLIYIRSGIYLKDTKKYLLENKILKRIIAKNLANFSEYIDLITSNPDTKELAILQDLILISETYFFRVPQQLEAIEKILIPEIANSKINETEPIINIWSASTFTGEEAYAISIILSERIIPIYPNIKFQIYGTDVNSNVLKYAKQGIYESYAVRNVPDTLKEKYFTKKDKRYALNDNVKSSVNFSQFNLEKSEDFSTLPSMDIVFCLNVLPNLDFQSKQKVVTDLYNKMTNGSYLFIGYSESLQGIRNEFKLVHLPKSMAYKKL